MTKAMKVGSVAALTLVLAGATLTAAAGSKFNMQAKLIGYEEVPAVSTTARGTFTASADGTSFTYTFSYSGLQGSVTQAHIHFGQKSVNGGISVFLCSNLGNGPAGTQPCPASPATITGTATAADVIGPAAQGIAAGEWDELIAAIRAGVAYVNVHSTIWPGGEARGQLRPGGDEGDQD